MSAAEFWQLPEGPPFFQLIGGELFMSPSPRFWHQEIVGNIYSHIREHLRRHPVGKVVVAPSDVELTPNDVYEPDIYFVSQERLGIITEQGVTGAPDLVIEVLSPSTAKLDAGPKRDVYAAAGVRELWLVSPQQRKIEIYTSTGRQLTLARTAAEGDTIETPLLDGLRFDVREIFTS
jgi:Uma2 family endonuclease